MSDSPANGGNDPPRGGLAQRLRTLFGRTRDKGLRESLEVALETHDAQNPGEVFREEARSMMHNLITFAGLRVDDVMVPRVDIVAIEDSAGMRDLLDRFTSANHSRIPVYRDTLDDITGMIHVKDFLRWMSVKGAKRRGKQGRSPGGLSIPAAELATTVKQAGLAREVLFVPPSMPASDLLVKMQASRIHLAIVIDEYGGTDGLVSIEDLVEEIVGDISDEHDTDEEELIRKTGEGFYTADGRLDIAALEELLGVELLSGEDREEADTLAGLVFEIAGRVPARGEIVRHGSGVEFEILESDPRRVRRLRIDASKLPPAPKAGDDMRESG